MSTGKIIEIYCRCGFLLFRYYKLGKGRLIKCLIPHLTEDNVGLTGALTLSKPLCLQCQKELGIIMMIHGSPALKLNQGSIRPIRI